MKNYLLLLAATSLLVACGVDDVPQPSLTETYQRDFIKTFGVIDENHTWRMVEQKSLTIELDEPSTVQVYVYVNGKYYIVANYKNVEGEQTLTYDVPSNATDVKVFVNGEPYEVETRAYIAPDDNGIIAKLDKYVYYTLGQIVFNFENSQSTESVLPEATDNRTKVSMDYMGTVTAEDGSKEGDAGYCSYTIYPIFWNADYNHTFGLYYYVGRTRKTIDFYKNKSGDCLQYLSKTATPGSREEDDWVDIETNYSYNWLVGGSRLGDDLTEFRNNIQNYKNNGFNDANYVFRGRAFQFTLPVGTTFGFYVKVNGQTTYYSNPSLNTGMNRDRAHAFSYYELEDDVIVNGNTTTRKTNTYICVEDMPLDGDKDYNDFIFLLEGTQTHIAEGEDQDPVRYLYTVEDLGGTYDYDFNDVVFEVSHIAGVDHLHVTPIAAGGSLPAYVQFTSGGTTTTSEEFHSYFGVGSDAMVNTNSYDILTTTDLNFSCPADWTHTLKGESNGFSVIIKKSGEQAVTVSEPSAGAAPQMLILNSGWAYPKEQVRINVPYPGFQEWGQGYKTNGWDVVASGKEGDVINYSTAVAE